MADKDRLRIDGKLLSELRVVDLKKELDNRKLSKSGSKKELVERLKSVCVTSRSTEVPVSTSPRHCSFRLWASLNTCDLK